MRRVGHTVWVGEGARFQITWICWGMKMVSWASVKSTVNLVSNCGWEEAHSSLFLFSHVLYSLEQFWSELGLFRHHLTSEFHQIDFHSLFSFSFSPAHSLYGAPVSLSTCLSICLLAWWVLLWVVSSAVVIFGVTLHTKAVAACWLNRPVVISLHSIEWCHFSLIQEVVSGVCINKLVPFLLFFFLLLLGCLHILYLLSSSIMTPFSCGPTSYLYIISVNYFVHRLLW